MWAGGSLAYGLSGWRPRDFAPFGRLLAPPAGLDDREGEFLKASEQGAHFLLLVARGGQALCRSAGPGHGRRFDEVAVPRTPGRFMPAECHRGVVSPAGPAAR